MKTQELTNLHRFYTVVMECGGTACATQFQAGSVQDAIRIWLDDLNLPGIYGLTEGQREGLARAAEDAHGTFLPFQQLHNVWLVTITSGDGSVTLLHIVERLVLGMPLEQDTETY